MGMLLNFKEEDGSKVNPGWFANGVEKMLGVCVGFEDGRPTVPSASRATDYQLLSEHNNKSGQQVKSQSLTC